ncbi:hypothetical protein KI688_005504 [Linnemannia hyalina]|uniref:CHY-type domain-containing protein n=1 Tax=Linnemannia hyalina TaxID=64524 RepID=A0A9P7Y3U4_9FUNG|nr:hypothetical protein KI688_005504 [Linnemannia hyalina]
MSTQHCQFFLTKKGCRNGDNCRFSHNNTPTPAPTRSTTSPTTDSSSITQATAPGPRRRVVPPATRQPVRKPVPASLQNLDEDTAAASLRSFEITQLASRFASSLTPRSASSSSVTDEESDNFELKIVPSDPDFPYEISALHVLLAVPKSYPTEPCSVQVLNRDIPKGFATNLERGFDQAAAQQQKSLLAHLNWLDVNMEQLLQKPPAPTIRFIGHANNNSNSSSRKSSPSNDTSSPVLPPPLPRSSAESTKKNNTPPKLTQAPAPAPSPQQPPPPVQKTYTPAERDQANVQRQKQMNQIQARFRSSFESLSPTSVNISLESTDKDKMPVKWQGPLWIVLLVPVLNVEQGFRKIVATMPQLSLFQLLNQLNRDLKDLMSLPPPSTAPSPTPQPSSAPTAQSSPLKDTPQPGQGSSRSRAAVNFSETDRNEHKGKVIYVDALQEPRKGNFDTIQDHGAITSDDEEDYDSSETEEESSEENHAEPTTTKNNNNSEDDGFDSEQEEEEEAESGSKAGGPVIESAPKRGIEIRMPDLKLDHISLLYCRSLSLLVRCNRCKALIDMPELVPDESTTSSSSSTTTGSGSGSGDKRKWRACENCQSLLGAHFRTEYIHMQSRTIGYLDLAGCTAYDILPSSFVPTCDECDHVHGSGPDEQHQGTVDHQNITTSTTDTSETTIDSTSTATSKPTTVPQRSSPTGFRQKVGRGMSATANCRKCHVRLTLTLDGEIKFVKLSPGDLMKASSSDLDLLPLKKKKNLAKNKNGLEFELQVGEPLPRKGACDHYKKSRRWFRFPCCSKIYPCHLCHDEKESESHESEYAKRMICGHCSREQAVSDKPCACGKSPIRTAAGSGAFWEGGEGMRDRTRMSHKDSRKHKGLHKTVAKKQVGAENIRKRAPKT